MRQGAGPYLSIVRRAPISDVIPLGQSNSISKLPRQGWLMVTVTATCSSVFIPDCLRSSAETESEGEGEAEGRGEEAGERVGGEKSSQPSSARQMFRLPHSTDENENTSQKLDTECEICGWFRKFTQPEKSASHEGSKERQRDSNAVAWFRISLSWIENNNWVVFSSQTAFKRGHFCLQGKK